MNSSKNLISKLYYYCWFLMAASVTLSKFSTSLFFIAICGLWIVSAPWKNIERWTLHRRTILISVAIYLVFVIGLWNTNNFDYAFKDLNSKLPLLVLPLVALTGPKISEQGYRMVLTFLVLGAVLSALIGFVRYKFFLPGDQLDFRSLSPFISHIRLSLVLCFAVGMIYYQIITSGKNRKWLLIFPLVFILYFLNQVQSLTSVVVLSGLAVYTFIFATNWKDKRWLRIAALSVFIGVLIFFAFKLNTIYQLTFAQLTLPEKLDERTVNGNPYQHYQNDLATENGHLVYWYICEREMRREWNKRSEIEIDSLVRGYPLKASLIRYLSSKGLRKDSLGISQLSNKDIAAIERGVSNYYYLKHGGIDARLHKALWELRRRKEGHSPYNNSIAMRFFFWDNAIQIIHEHFWLGVGTGDVQDIIKEQYEKSEFANYPKVWRTHNQFLTVLISGGVFMFLIFTWTWYRLFRGVSRSNYLYHAGFLLVVLSMFWEDTLETQAGSSIVALLVLVPFVLHPRNRKEQQNISS